MSGYEYIKELQRQLRASGASCTVKKMLALAPNNDPYYSGSPAQIAQAEWFAEIWQRFGYAQGVHLRRIHYQLAIQPDSKRHDGMAYENTEACWDLLSNASRHARYLDLVPAHAFEDRRNPTAEINFEQPDWHIPAAVTISTEGSWRARWKLPYIEPNIAADAELYFPDPVVEGMHYHPTNQPFLVELWVEKTTMNDVLVPICQRLGVNLVLAAGFQSVTNVIRFLERVQAAGKPARVFCITDFDPSGNAMPVSIARQIEYWQAAYAPGIDIKCTQLALTAEQVTMLGLPRQPVKATDGRKDKFELLYGTGAVELDALEALRPGDLATIVRDAITPYRDESLPQRTQRARMEVQRDADEQWREMTIDQRGELADLESEIRTIASHYQGRLAALSNELNDEFKPYLQRLETLWHGIQFQSEAFDVDVPEVEPELAVPDEAAWLYASEREYLEQLAYYRAREVEKTMSVHIP